MGCQNVVTVLSPAQSALCSLDPKSIKEYSTMLCRLYSAACALCYVSSTASVSDRCSLFLSIHHMPEAQMKLPTTFNGNSASLNNWFHSVRSVCSWMRSVEYPGHDASYRKLADILYLRSWNAIQLRFSNFWYKSLMVSTFTSLISARR